MGRGHGADTRTSRLLERIGLRVDSLKKGFKTYARWQKLIILREKDNMVIVTKIRYYVLSFFLNYIGPNKKK